MSNGWIALPEAANYLKISKDLLYKLAGADKVPSYKIGRIWRFNKIELDSWVKQNGHAQPIVEAPALFDIQTISRANISKVKTQDGQEITKICGDIPNNLPINNGDRFLFISYDQSLFTHSLHRFPAKFFPELPRWIIRKYTSENDWVLDPFCGSATANLEALLLSRNSVGIDIDPFAKFLARVKITPLSTSLLEESFLHLKGKIKEYDKHVPSKKGFPDFPYRDNWFNQYVLEELTFLKREIISLKDNVFKDKEEASKIINFFLVCFSSIIRTVSNADNNCTRTVIRKRLNKKIYKGEALERFLTAIEINVPKMIEFSLLKYRGEREF